MCELSDRNASYVDESLAKNQRPLKLDSQASDNSSADARMVGQLAAPEPAQKSWTLLAYGALALPLEIAEIPILLYLPAFYAQEMELNANAVGVVFFLARVWDGLSDLLVGWLSDRTRSRFGRRKPWVVLGAPFLVISAWYLCNPPKTAGLLYLGIYGALFYASFTAVKIPHLSWGTELATDYFQRSRVSTYRETFGMLGDLLFVSVPLVLLGENPQLHEVLFLQAAAVLLLVPITLLPLVRWVKDPPPLEITRTRFMTELADLAKDRILRRFLLGRFIFQVEEGITNSLLVFSFSVGFGLSTRDFFWAILTLYIVSLLMTPATLRLARYVEKHYLLAGAVALQALAYFVASTLPGGSLARVLPVWVLIGIANSAMNSMPRSIIADIIDSADVTSGERRSGTYVAVDNLLYKLGMALGVGISFGLLTWCGFDATLAHHGPGDTQTIRLLGFGLPAFLCIAAAIVYLTHPITKSVQRDLRARIQAREIATLGR
jgi:GPH family glycoside/pentoside/hexuronide:cation symporter